MTETRPWWPVPVVVSLILLAVLLVVVHSIPSGPIGVARYLQRDVPIVSWVTRLGTRAVPADIERLLSGRRRVALVRIHDLSEQAAPETWPRAHALLLGREAFRHSSAEILYFGPLQGDTFLPATSPVVSRSTAAR